MIMYRFHCICGHQWENYTVGTESCLNCGTTMRASSATEQRNNSMFYESPLYESGIKYTQTDNGSIEASFDCCCSYGNGASRISDYNHHCKNCCGLNTSSAQQINGVTCYCPSWGEKHYHGTGPLNSVVIGMLDHSNAAPYFSPQQSMYDQMYPTNDYRAVVVSKAAELDKITKAVETAMSYGNHSTITGSSSLQSVVPTLTAPVKKSYEDLYWNYVKMDATKSAVETDKALQEVIRAVSLNTEHIVDKPVKAQVANRSIGRAIFKAFEYPVIVAAILITTLHILGLI